MPRNRKLTEERIREAALGILQEQGFEAWGINAIARKAGADKVLIYRYFDSLDGLLKAVIEITEFWPDPECLSTDSPKVFLTNTLHKMHANRCPWILLSHPSAASSGSAAMQKFNRERERWILGLEQYLHGTGDRTLLEQLALLVFAAAITDGDAELPLAFWDALSSQMDWPIRQTARVDEELPVELL